MKRNKITILIAMALLAVVCGVVSGATVTQSITYQGKLTNAAGSPLTGTYSVTFRLYDAATGGTTISTDTHSVTSANGLFTTQVAVSNPALADGRALWLGVKVGTDPEMTPRQEIRPVPYALSLRPGAILSGTGPSGTFVVMNTANGAIGINVSTSGVNTPAIRASTANIQSTAIEGITNAAGSAAVTGSAHGADSDGLSGTSEKSAGVSGKGVWGGIFETNQAGSGGFIPNGIWVNADYDNNRGLIATTSGDNSPGISSETAGSYSNAMAAKTTGPFSKGIAVSTGSTGSDGISVVTQGEESTGVKVDTRLKNSPGITSATSGTGSTGISSETTASGSNAVSAKTSGTGSDGVSVRTDNSGSDGIDIVTKGASSFGVRAWTRNSSSPAVFAYGEGAGSNGVMARSDSGSTDAVKAEAYGPGSRGVSGTSAQDSGVYGKGVWGGIFETNQAGSGGFIPNGIWVNAPYDNNRGLIATTSGDNSPGVTALTDGKAAHALVAKTTGNTSYGLLAESSGGDFAHAIVARHKGPASIYLDENQASAVWAESYNGTGVTAVGRKIGVYARSWNGYYYGFFTPDEGYAGKGWSSPSTDVAEYMPVARDITPGTVLVIGPDGKLRPSASAYDTKVVGIVSTAPGVSLGKNDTTGNKGEALVALAGRVPCRVDASNGAIHPGDMLSTSGRPGYAMKAEPVNVSGIGIYRPGTVVAKALGTLESGTGTIEVVVTLQ